MIGTDQNLGESYLTLGWQVTPGQDPRYWLSSDPRPGSQPLRELVRVPANTIGNHTAIIAQSGSGKSFFLGRIVEEIMLQTSAHCLILDPNADFRKVREVENEDLWEKARYDPLKGRGKLPHEPSREDFVSRWSKIPIRIRTGAGARGEGYEQLQIWWPSLSMAFLAGDLDAMLRSDLYHCHNFVKDFGAVFEIRYSASEEPRDFLEEVQKLFDRLRALPKEECPRALAQEFSTSQIIRDITSKGYSSPLDDYIFLDQDVRISRSEIKRRITRFIDSALTVTDYVSENVQEFYFKRAREYQTAGIIRTSIKGKSWGRSRSGRLDVIDLPSLPDTNTRLLAIDAILTTKWDEARRAWNRALEKKLEKDARTPIFIVVDEAHNLIPNKPRTKAAIALREQFRTIVAEGRKYGLFLILVSQRPDKLDPLVLSECENKAVMRLSSVSVLKITLHKLGLEDLPPKLLEKCLDFETGRVLLAGPWSPEGPKILYAAARRTIEGGRNLRADYWAVPPEISALNLATDVNRRAIELTAKHPGVAFTCGRRTIEEQAKLMAEQIVENRTWINDTFMESTARQKLQSWLDLNPTAVTEDQIALGLKKIIKDMSESEREKVSPHLTGTAFDIQPPPVSSEQIKSDIKALRGVKDLMENENGKVVWHVQFQTPLDI
jgi:DNA helicase HerA-like ATPase